jgi:hypothetical protein
MLEEAPRCTHCFLVHHETTTGMLNPLAEVAALCRARGVSLIVDAMSSLGGAPLDVRVTPADYVISSANKCLQGMPGLAFAIADRGALARTAKVPRRGVYLDLHAQWQAQENEQQFSVHAAGAGAERAGRGAGGLFCGRPGGAPRALRGSARADGRGHGEHRLRAAGAAGVALGIVDGLSRAERGDVEFRGLARLALRARHHDSTRGKSRPRGPSASRRSATWRRPILIR